MNTFNIKIFLLCLCFFVVEKSQGQNKFKAAAVAGLTAAQLGGDSISGYDKMGFTFGGHLRYDIGSKLDINMELLFTQRGSRNSFGLSSGG